MRLFLVFFSWCILLILPQFSIKSFGLIDDGTDFLYAKNNSFSQITIDELFLNERTRPLKYLIKKMSFEIFGFNMVGYFIIEAALLAVCIYLMYLILTKISRSSTMIYLGILFFGTSAPVVANFYRLGTDEGWQLGLLLMAIYLWFFCFFRKYMWILYIQ